MSLCNKEKNQWPSDYQQIFTVTFLEQIFNQKGTKLHFVSVVLCNNCPARKNGAQIKFYLKFVKSLTIPGVSFKIHATYYLQMHWEFDLFVCRITLREIHLIPTDTKTHNIQIDHFKLKITFCLHFCYNVLATC